MKQFTSVSNTNNPFAGAAIANRCAVVKRGTNIPLEVEYTSSTPSTIHDVTYPEGHNYTKEHPNEVLAYGLEKYIR